MVCALMPKQAHAILDSVIGSRKIDGLTGDQCKLFFTTIGADDKEQGPPNPYDMEHARSSTYKFMAGKP